MPADHATALHESCHAVIARILGLSVTRATADPANPHVHTPICADELVLERAIVVDLAAGVLDSSAAACATDENIAAARCRKVVAMRHRLAMDNDLAVRVHAAILARLRRYAVALVHKHRPAIDRVAAKLAEGETLNQAEIDALINTRKLSR
jgi:hypothetical protein